MNRHWTAASNFFEIAEMPFYWRLSGEKLTDSIVRPRMPIRVVADETYDYLKYEPVEADWANLSEAYRRNENIGFVNPESGQLQTYGSSVNRFFLEAIQTRRPKSIFEIGCGAGFTLQFLKENGWTASGIDPSEYSQQWSERLGFPLINSFFDRNVLDEPAECIFCNDVFEHVREVDKFCATVFDCLADGGIFCFATTNSTQSIAVGDISIFEHQHVNMFTERSITLLLRGAGFAQIDIRSGSYGNTFQVVATKDLRAGPPPLPTSPVSCQGYFERAQEKVVKFQKIFERTERLHCYVPLRSLPYLATVGDFGNSPIYDSNPNWRGRYIDGYEQPIRSIEDIVSSNDSTFFVGSLTFFTEIKNMLLSKKVPEHLIYSMGNF